MRQSWFYFMLFIFFLASMATVRPVDIEHRTSSVASFFGGTSFNPTAYGMPTGPNSYMGWVYFPGGFTLGTGNNIFNIIAPVSGTIDFNDATMTLSGDMILESDASISNDGIIDGDGHALIFSDTLTLNSSLYFSGNTIIDGQNNALVLGANGDLSVNNGIELTLQNLILKDLDAAKIIMRGTGSTVHFDNVTIWFDGDYTFTQGTFTFGNDVTIAGSTHKFTLQSDQGMKIERHGMLTIDHGVTFSYDNQSSKFKVNMDDATSHLVFNGSKLTVNTTGLRLSDGTIVFDGLVTVSAEGQSSTNDFTIHTNATTIMLPGANIEIYGYNSIDSDLFVWGTQNHFILMDVSSKLSLGGTSNVFCKNNIMALDSRETLATTVYDTSNANDIGCKTLFELKTKMDIMHGVGDLEINTTTTDFAYNIWLSKHHRLNVNVSNHVFIDGQTHFIHCARESAEPTGSDPMIILDDGGSVKGFNFYNLVFKDFSPQYISLLNTTSVRFCDGTTIEMTNDEMVDSNYTMSFSGEVIINCFGSELNLGHFASSMDVLAGSTLIIKNACLTGLTGNNLNLVGNDSTLTLSNCSIHLTDTYTIPRGYLNIMNDVYIDGPHPFVYQSAQPLTIDSHSRLLFGLNTRFYYNASTNDRVEMRDETSQIWMNGSIFHAGAAGIELTNGTLVIDHIVTFSGDDDSISGAFIFGNGTASQNLDIEIMPGGNINETHVYLSYNDID